MLIKGIPPIIIVLFIGPWSDNCGRKVLMILPVIGFILNYLWFLVNAIYFEELVAEYLMFEVVDYWLGGWTCFFLGIYSYITDVSTPHSRALRIGLLDRPVVAPSTSLLYTYLHIPDLTKTMARSFKILTENYRNNF